MKTFVNRLKYTALLAGGLMVMQSCVDNTLIEGPETYGTDPITLSATYQTHSRANDYGFADGDNMGIYIVDYIDGNPGSLNDANLRADNIKFTLDEAADRWNGSTTIYWKDKTTEVDIYGYYPFEEVIDNPTNHNFAVRTRQDESATPTTLGGYEASDLLWAKTEKVSPTDKRINLNYTHALAGVTIRLQEGSGFGNGEFAKSHRMVWIDNTVNEATVDFQNQLVTVASVQPRPVYTLEHNGEYRAVVIPQTVKGGNAIVGMTIDGQNYRLTKDTDIMLLSGKMHTFTIKVDKRSESGDYQLTLADESITPWIDDADFHDGIVREYICVDITTPGTLSEVLKEKRLDKETVTNMKVSGTLNVEDLYFMGREMTGLSALNLRDVVIDDENDDYDDMIVGFNDHPCLHHIVLPSKLRAIGPEAFTWVKIAGTLEIPEGVEIIHDNAFRVHHGHVGAEDVTTYLGHLSLPSTLRYVGEAAFQGYRIIDDCPLPDNLEVIETSAFSTAGFKGQLILPSALKVLGSYGISGDFDGDLVIPQGLEIRWGAFGKCRFTGSLELPEGITEIGSCTFFGCGFRGELKLPSTLTRICDRAFAENLFTKIIWSENIKIIDGEAFCNCDRLQGTLTLPPKLSVIEPRTFEGCRLITGIELHEDVEFISEEAFAWCESVNSIVSKAIVPPAMCSNSFLGIHMDNFPVEVPAASVQDYKSDRHWGEFKRITAYSNFVCRPMQMCALNNEHYQTIVLNADGDWRVTHIPDWVRISQTSGKGKTQLAVTVAEKAHGTESRVGYIEFTLGNGNVTTRFEINQYEYEYNEDQLVKLQGHTKGDGIKIVMLADGWSGKEISEGLYMQQCLDDVRYFFGVAPYDRFREYFDVYAAISLSQESGINTINTYRDTRFSTIYGGCMENLIPDEELILSYLHDEHGSILSDDDLRRGLIILIPNTVDYTGDTYYFNFGTISLCPPSENPYPYDSRGIVQHEACGHGFGKLGDENVVHNQFAPNSIKGKINDYHWREWYMNLSCTGAINSVPWSHMIFDPRYSDRVDVFEGGAGYSRGIYRSETSSCMSSYVPYFNAISRQYITKRIQENSGHWFEIEEFYANDTNAWGDGGNRAADSYDRKLYNHKSPTQVTGDQNQTLLKKLRKQQIVNN